MSVLASSSGTREHGKWGVGVGAKSVEKRGLAKSWGQRPDTRVPPLTPHQGGREAGGEPRLMELELLHAYSCLGINCLRMPPKSLLAPELPILSHRPGVQSP